MKNCTECNYKFTFKDRLKSTSRGKLKCKMCHSVYKEERSIYVFIYNFVVLFVVLMSQSEFKLENPILNFSIYMLFTVTTLMLFHLIPHRLKKYKKVTSS